MTVGIITWYGVTNYGSALQAYAMQQLVTQLGRDSTILRHRVHENSHANQRRRASLRSLYPGTRAAQRGELQKQRAVSDFRDEYLNVSSAYLEDCAVDLALIGSDQVFDIRGFQPFQFGLDVNATKVTAYAPSFGETTYDDLRDSPHRNKVELGLRRMAKLSVRDENSRAIVKEVTGDDPPVVLDPTLLYDFSDEKTQWTTPAIERRYALIYTWGGVTTTKEFASAVQTFSRAHNLQTVSVGDTRPWCDVNFHGASPSEYVSLISRATVVITNMFHGSCFALANNVPILPLVMPHNEHKLGGLLTQFGLTNHRVDDVMALGTADIPTIDFNQLAQRLASERHSSRQFLEAALTQAE
jgi:hypothetical protein